jgi:DNA-directed RNA polymerase specialized sigma24 family protein
MTDAETDRMARMWSDGVPARAIGEAVGCSVGTVHSVARMHRDRFPLRNVRVDADTRAIWTLRMLAGHVQPREVAAALGVDRSTPSKWKRDAERRGGI